MSCIPKDAPLHSCLHQQAGEQDLTREWGWGLIPAMISFSLVLSTFRCQNPAPIPPGEGLWESVRWGSVDPGLSAHGALQLPSPSLSTSLQATARYPGPAHESVCSVPTGLSAVLLYSSRLAQISIVLLGSEHC